MLALIQTYWVRRSDRRYFSCIPIARLITRSIVKSQRIIRLIQVTALDPDDEGSVRNHIIEMVKEIESDPHIMQMLLDKGGTL